MQTLTQTPTFHAVDDKGLSFAESLLVFTDAFRFPLRLKSLSNTGLTARFHITHPDQIESFYSRANRVIKVLRLPLEATLKLTEIGGVMLESQLVIRYVNE